MNSKEYQAVLTRLLTYFYCPELMHVRSDVTKWRWSFLLWKKPEEKLSKMADVQFQKMTTGFELFFSLSKGNIYFYCF